MRDRFPAKIRQQIRYPREDPGGLPTWIEDIRFPLRVERDNLIRLESLTYPPTVTRVLMLESFSDNMYRWKEQKVFCVCFFLRGRIFYFVISKHLFLNAISVNKQIANSKISKCSFWTLHAHAQTYKHTQHTHTHTHRHTHNEHTVTHTHIRAHTHKQTHNT